MKRLESQEDYLEKILQLSKENSVVHAIDIARGLSFSKPSVSIAMNKLKEAGYIDPVFPLTAALPLPALSMPGRRSRNTVP